MSTSSSTPAATSTPFEPTVEDAPDVLRENRTEKRTPISLRQMRLTRMLSLTELATRSGLAVSTLTALEHGLSRKPHLATIRKLSVALACPPQAIVWPGDPFRELLDPSSADPNTGVTATDTRSDTRSDTGASLSPITDPSPCR